MSPHTHRRAFTVAEANALIPQLELVLREVERRMERVRSAAERLQVLDVLWGANLLQATNPDHAEAQRDRLEIATLMGEIEQIVDREIHGRALRFPQGGLEHGLIDFPTTWEGRWVYLCWKRGEPAIEAWHEISDGFAGRQNLTSEQIRAMGRQAFDADDDGAPW
jgi:hypothetical protein